MWQPAGSSAIDAKDLAIPLAKSLLRYLLEHCSEFARVLETRRMESGVELVSVELDVELPQRPVYAIARSEIVTICLFPLNAGHPLIAIGRPDFPDTPHQALVFEGLPSFICVDDRPWQDIRGGYTAAELVSRIMVWFAKAAQGELHGDDQPFEPIFSDVASYEIILLKQAEDAMARGEKLDIWATDQSAKYLVVTSAKLSQAARVKNLHLHIAHATVAPEAMKRMRRAPRNLKQLGEFLADRGVPLPDILAESIDDWMNKGKGDKDARWVFCLLVTMPQIHPSTKVLGRLAPMAFICETSPGTIGLAMGILSKNDSDEAEGVNYLPMLLVKPSLQGLEEIPVLISNIHPEFNQATASAMASSRVDDRRLLLVGAGSLGSSLSETLVRQGLFRWTIVDDDDFLPHNAARHNLTTIDVGLGKAMRLAERLQMIRTDAAASWINANILRDVADQTLAAAIDEADLLLDASASVPVSRRLSDLHSSGRSICAFFTPNGRSAVLMVESSDRSINLRGLETSYLREVLTNQGLKDHFGAGEEMRYTGACRALTNRIPTSSVAILSGLIASGITNAVRDDSSALKIWTIRSDGGIDCVTTDVAVVSAPVDDWKVILPSSLHRDLVERREVALPNETGGALVGMIDYDAGRIDIVEALMPPEDSVGNPQSFTRGRRGLQKQIETASLRSGGQVRYLGEWHSHPRGASASPSGTDIVQIRQLSLILEMDDLPAISLIISESGMAFMIGEVIS